MEQFGLTYECHTHRHTAVSGCDHSFIFRSWKPQRLVSQLSFFLLHARCSQTCWWQQQQQRQRCSPSPSASVPPTLFLFSPFYIFHQFCSLTLNTSLLTPPLIHISYLVGGVFLMLLSSPFFLSFPSPTDFFPPFSLVLHSALSYYTISFICSCVWNELSTSASGQVLKKETGVKKKRNRKDEVQYSRAPAPEGPSQTRQREWKAFACRIVVLDSALVYREIRRVVYLRQRVRHKRFQSGIGCRSKKSDMFNLKDKPSQKHVQNQSRPF